MDRPELAYFRHHVFVCTNERKPDDPRGSCARKGAVKLRDYMKMRTKSLRIPGARVNVAGCLDRCELGPCLVVYPDNIWYRAETEADIDEILQSHLIDGVVVERLALRRTDSADD